MSDRPTTRSPRKMSDRPPETSYNKHVSPSSSCTTRSTVESSPLLSIGPPPTRHLSSAESAAPSQFLGRSTLRKLLPEGPKKRPNHTGRRSQSVRKSSLRSRLFDAHLLDDDDVPGSTQHTEDDWDYCTSRGGQVLSQDLNVLPFDSDHSITTRSPKKLTLDFFSETLDHLEESNCSTVSNNEASLDLKLTFSRPNLTLKDESAIENQHEVFELFLAQANESAVPCSSKPALNSMVARASGIEGPLVSRPSLYLEEEHLAQDQLELFPERAKGAAFSHGPFGSSYPNLVELSLNPIRSNCFSLAKEVNVKLETADLSHSMFRSIPDLPMAQRLQVLRLQYCINLVDLSSVCHFTRLEHLVLKGCVNLTSIPSLVNNTSLLSLDLSDCLNVKKISEFPTSMKYLYLANTAIEELPLSMKYLLNLLALDLRDCRRLKNLLELPESLQHLHLGYTAIEELPPSIGHLASLVVLNLRDCRRLKSLPSSITRLKALKILSLSGCNNLLYMRELTEQMAYEYMQQECIDELFRKRFNPWDINSVLLKKRVTEKVENLLTDNPEVITELLGAGTLTTICDVSLLKLLSFFRITASKSLSIILRMENFLEFNLPFNNLQQLWAGKLGLVNLRSINLNHSSLVRLPDLSETGSLVSLNLRCCLNLVEVSSVDNLAKLENLDLRGCKGLTILPSLAHLEVLKTLYLSGCSNLKELPSSIGRLKDLVLLDLKNCTGLYKLPRSISDLKHLQVLNIAGCRNLLKCLNSNQIKELPLLIGNHFSGKTSEYLEPNFDKPVFVWPELLKEALKFSAFIHEAGKEAASKKAKKECDVIIIDEDRGVLDDKETATCVQRLCTRKEAKKEYDLVILDEEEGDPEDKEAVGSEASKVQPCTRKKAKKEHDLIILDEDQGDLEHNETVGNEALIVEVRKRKRQAVKLSRVASKETKINKQHFNLYEAMGCRHESFLRPEEYEKSQLIEDVLVDSSLSAPESSAQLVPHPKSIRSSPLSSVPGLHGFSSMVQRVSNKPQDACNPVGPYGFHHFEEELNGGTVSGRSSADVHERKDEITRLREHLAALKRRRNDLCRKNSSVAERLEPLHADLVDQIGPDAKMKVEQDAKNAWELTRNLVADIARKLQTKI